LNLSEVTKQCIGLGRSGNGWHCNWNKNTRHDDVQ
jgi:hypothetical protein